MEGKRDFEELEKRRMEAADLFRAGKSRAFVARQLGVSRQTSGRWYSVWQEDGKRGLRAAGRAGRKPKLTANDIDSIKMALLEGPEAYGFSTQLWTLERIGQVIEKRCHVLYHRGHVWKILKAMGWSCQRPVRRAREKDEKRTQRWLKRRWPEVKKSPFDRGFPGFPR